jgi:two-component sensor histidine kinase
VVALRVDARVRDERVELAVSDDGRWKPPGPPASHRGHGLKLIEALADSVRLTPAEAGTTVELTKALRP